MKKYFLLCICSALFYVADAQKVLHVASQRFEEKVSYEIGDVLKLDLEKVQVAIIGKNQDYYAFEIVIKSRHKDQDQAIKELQYLKYQLKDQGDTIHFSNDFISGDNFQKVQGILNVELIITAPKSSQLVIENAFGTSEVRNISSFIDLKGKFVETKVDQCQGRLTLSSVFGDNSISDHQGDIVLDISRVDLVGKRIKGNIKGKASYGSITFTQLGTKNLTIDARKTAFTLELDNASLKHFNYEIVAQLGSILIEGDINEEVRNEWSHTGTSDSKINISTTFSPVIIRNN